MMANTTLSRPAYIYLYGVIAVGCITIGHSVLQLTATPTSKQWLVLAALTLLASSFSIRIPSVPARLSVSEAFIFASVLLFGPAAATVTVALDSVVMSLSRKRLGAFRLRFFFNPATVALSVWVAANAFFGLANVRPGQLEELLPLENRFWPLVALAGIYFLLNTWLVALAIAFEKRLNLLKVWSTHFLWFGLNYFAGVSVAALLVSYTQSVDLSAIAIILPLLALSYLGYRTSLGRIEDAKRHVAHVEDLYLSTIETLAMAVDAKDQATHGHIRRVQTYAVNLACALGVRDEQQLKALEAAALLHDTGKLAIPEHILNKPGKLTDAEFGKMKRHADIGADLVAAIKFPYPVVPIVRHHHEQWDGKGYPAGIAGSDIPIGARILAVADCFDALTSDRPYRPRLSNDEAFEILRERSGTMYDPLVVDTFVSTFPAVASAAFQRRQDGNKWRMRSV